MKKVVCVAFLLSVMLPAAVPGLEQQDKKLNQRERDDCPRNKCCLWRLGLVTQGKTEYKLDMPHMCPTGSTQHGSGFLELKPLKLSEGCNEQELIPDGSQLNAAIHPLRRDDDLNHLCGRFSVQYKGKILFEGDIELLHRINTHHKPFGNAPCDPKFQIQGWLNGKGTDDRTRAYLLRAMLVASTDPIDRGTKGYHLAKTNIDGVLIKCDER